MDKYNDRKPILIYDSLKYFVPFFNKKGIKTYSLFSKLAFIPRLLRKIFFILKMPETIWYSEWKNELADAKTVIIFSSEYNKVLKFIKSINPEIRVIYWYWNPVFRSSNPDDIPNELCEKWSFDRSDCEKYLMKYNTQFYFDNIVLPQNDVIYDVIFFGADKGRKAHLEEIRCKIDELHLKSYFYIVDDGAKKANYKGQFPPFGYQEYLNIVSKSKAILDYIQEGQTGLTLRPLEALFFKKKLITNDLSIKQNDFYHPNNIFVIGIDKEESLVHFLNMPYRPVKDEILSFYDVDNWIKRFTL
jgi:hypothetical protein